MTLKLIGDMCPQQANCEQEVASLAFLSAQLEDEPLDVKIASMKEDLVAVMEKHTLMMTALPGKNLNLQVIEKEVDSMLMRWALALSQYKMEITAIPGSQNTFADLLSRAECEQSMP